MKEDVLSKKEQNLGSDEEAGENFPGFAVYSKSRLMQISLAGWPCMQCHVLLTPSASV